MKKLVLIVSMAILASAFCLGQDEITLRQELSILKPLVGKTWICETKDPSGQMTLHMLMKYEPMHDGKVLKYYQETKELKNRNDGYFYYDPDKKEIAFLALNSNGNIAVGNVKEEEGKILKYGYAIFPDRKLEFRNTLEITPDGKLVDKYFRFDNGEWQAGHSVTYSVTEFPKLTGPYLGQKPPGATPEIFAPGIVSKEGNQGELNISPDLNEIIYWERKPPDNLNTFIRIVRDMDQWKAPEILPFSRDYINNEPSLSPDGKKLFFVSNRPKKINGAPERTSDIWFVEKVAGKWGDPVNLGAPINSDGVEVQPFMSAEPCFYFCKPPAEIYCSKFSGGT